MGESDVRASMTGRDNLIIILMWDVMNNSRWTDNTHTHTQKHTHNPMENAHACTCPLTPLFPVQRHKPSPPPPPTTTLPKGQCISIHYMEQHITMCAFISATEVNALHRAVHGGVKKKKSSRRLLNARTDHLRICFGGSTSDTKSLWG